MYCAAEVQMICLPGQGLCFGLLRPQASDLCGIMRCYFACCWLSWLADIAELSDEHLPDVCLHDSQMDLTLMCWCPAQQCPGSPFAAREAGVSMPGPAPGRFAAERSRQCHSSRSVCFHGSQVMQGSAVSQKHPCATQGIAILAYGVQKECKAWRSGLGIKVIRPQANCFRIAGASQCMAMLLHDSV